MRVSDPSRFGEDDEDENDDDADDGQALMVCGQQACSLAHRTAPRSSRADAMCVRKMLLLSHGLGREG